MRLGFDGLFSLVRTRLLADPLSGHLFVFRNRTANRLKVLYWGGHGLCLWCQKQESDHPYSCAFTELGALAHNLTDWPASASAVDANLLIRDARRRLMSQIDTAVAPPRAQRSRCSTPSFGIN